MVLEQSLAFAVGELVSREETMGPSSLTEQVMK